MRIAYVTDTDNTFVGYITGTYYNGRTMVKVNRIAVKRANAKTKKIYNARPIFLSELPIAFEDGTPIEQFEVFENQTYKLYMIVPEEWSGKETLFRVEKKPVKTKKCIFIVDTYELNRKIAKEKARNYIMKNLL